MCACSVRLNLKLCWQVWHLWRYSKCSRSCCANASLLLKLLLHILQWKAPCTVKARLLLKLILQTLQAKGLSSEWVTWWFLRLRQLVNLAPQIWQVKGFSFMCTTACCFKSLFVLNAFGRFTFSDIFHYKFVAELPKWPAICWTMMAWALFVSICNKHSFAID